MEAGYRAKTIRKDAVKMKWKLNGTTWGDITRKRRNANRGVEKRLTRLKEMYGEEYHFPRRSVNETTPHLRYDFVPLTKRESIGERRDRRQKENAQDIENFLKAIPEKVLTSR